MFSWIAANAATVVIGVILLLVVSAAVRYVYKRAKSGKCIGCDGGCGSCPNGHPASIGGSE